MNPYESSKPNSRGLLIGTALAAIIGTAIVVAVIMPAEFRKDPTGIGRMTGLLDLTTPVVEMPPSGEAESAKPETTTGAIAKSYGTPFRTDTVKIPIGPDGELEYKATMKEGQTMIYSWSVDKGAVYFDFHGETADGKNGQKYEEVQETKSANGAFVAPFDGKHGWYWLNVTGEHLTVTLKLAGYYESHDYVK